MGFWMNAIALKVFAVIQYLLINQKFSVGLNTSLDYDNEHTGWEKT